MSRLVVVKVAFPIDAPLGSALTKMPTRMRAGFLRVMAEIGHQKQSGLTAPELAPPVSAGADRETVNRPDRAAAPQEQPEAIALRRAW